MSPIDATVAAGEKGAWSPSGLIDVFCRPGLRSGFRESGRKDDERSDWYPGFCAYMGKDSYGPGVDGFDDGHCLWGELIRSGWTLIQDPGDRQFPYSFYMQWQPRAVVIRFTPQAWINDYAVEVDPEGPVTFTVPIADAQDDQGQWLEDDSFASDRLREHEHAPRWIREWSGPFTIEIQGAAPDAHWCMASYCEGDFGVEMYDDEAAYREAERKVRAL